MLIVFQAQLAHVLSPAMTRLVSLLLLLLLAAAAAAQPDLPPDAILIDATYVDCTDTTESLLVLRDGRTMYALGNRGAMVTVTGALLNDLKRVVDSTGSGVETKDLDSCNTLGVILEGPRFLLINPRRPAREARDLFNRMERLRQFVQRKMQGTIDHFSERLELDPDTTMHKLPTVAPAEIRRKIRFSPVAREWRCHGTVVVAAMITPQGTVRQAFVRNVRTRGKCSALLSTMALRAVLLASFEPAVNRNGKPALSWVEVEVPFARPK